MWDLLAMTRDKVFSVSLSLSLSLYISLCVLFSFFLLLSFLVSPHPLNLGGDSSPPYQAPQNGYRPTYIIPEFFTGLQIQT